MLDRIACGVLSVFLVVEGITASAIAPLERSNPTFAKPAKDGAPGRPGTITVPFVLDHDRVFVELDFVKPDGTIRKARAFIGSGMRPPARCRTLPTAGTYLSESGPMASLSLVLCAGAITLKTVISARKPKRSRLLVII